MTRTYPMMLIVACAACTSVSDVTPMGRDTFMVGAQARGGFISTTDLVAMSAQKANAYCAGIGKSMTPDNIKNSGVRGFTPQENTFIFRCLDDNDPGNARPVLRPAPTTVIEMKH